MTIDFHLFSDDVSLLRTILTRYRDILDSNVFSEAFPFQNAIEVSDVDYFIQELNIQFPDL